MSVLQREEYIQVRPQRVISDASFSGTIMHQYLVPSNRRVDLSRSYYEINLKVRAGGVAAEDQALGRAGFGLSNNPASVLFNSGYFEINNKQVSRLNHLPQSNTVLRLTGSDGPENHSVGSENPITPVTSLIHRAYVTEQYSYIFDQSTIPPTSDVVLGSFLTSPLEYKRIQNVLKSGFNLQQDENTLILPFPFYMQDAPEALPGSTTLTTNLQVDQLWRNMLFNTDTDRAGNVQSFQTIPTTNSLHADVKDVILWLYTYESQTISPSMVFNSEYVNISSTLESLPSNQLRTQINVPENTHRVMFGFFNNQIADTTVDSAYPSCVAANTLKRFRVTYNGQQLPATEYNFSPSIYTGGGAERNTNFRKLDGKRAYSDYVRVVTGGGMSGTLLSFDEWANSPIFVFDVSKNGNDVSNQLLLDVQYGEKGDNDVLWIGSMHKKELEIQYGANMQIQEVAVSSI